MVYCNQFCLARPQSSHGGVQMKTLAQLGELLTLLRPILESLFFLATIALAVFAFKGLEQLKLTLVQLEITREIANKNTQREAFKLAAEQCRYYGDYIVPLQSKAREECNQFKITCFADPRFKIVGGEIVEHNFDKALVTKEMGGDRPGLVSFLNSLEGFALFFVSGIAEEKVGYQETATSFCTGVRKYMPLIWLFRSVGVRYESTVKLYEIWSNRQESEALTKSKDSIDAKLKSIKTENVKTLGT
jgi:hypothetical protein